jgi:hypothetical protein
MLAEMLIKDARLQGTKAVAPLWWVSTFETLKVLTTVST